MTSAFELGANARYLSVNWLEYFVAQYLEEAIDRVCNVFLTKGYRLRPNGRFATLNVGDCDRPSTN